MIELCSYVVLWRNIFFTQKKFLALLHVKHCYNAYMGVNDEIRKAIQKNAKSRYRIAKETGLSEALLCLFMKGYRNLRLENLEAVADCIGYKITIRPKKRGK